MSVRCSVVTGRLTIDGAGVVLRGAIEAVCCCIAVDESRAVDIAGVVVRGVAEVVDGHGCMVAPVGRTVCVTGVDSV